MHHLRCSGIFWPCWQLTAFTCWWPCSMSGSLGDEGLDPALVISTVEDTIQEQVATHELVILPREQVQQHITTQEIRREPKETIIFPKAHSKTYYSKMSLVDLGKCVICIMLLYCRESWTLDYWIMKVKNNVAMENDAFKEKITDTHFQGQLEVMHVQKVVHIILLANSVNRHFTNKKQVKRHKCFATCILHFKSLIETLSHKFWTLQSGHEPGIGIAKLKRCKQHEEKVLSASVICLCSWMS